MESEAHQDHEGESRAAASDVDNYEGRLTPREQAILLEGSGLSRTAELARRSDLSSEIEQAMAEDTAGERTNLLAASVTLTEVAQLLGEPVASVVTRTAEGGLVRFSLESHDRYPLWQFHDGKPLPGLSEVVAALPPTWRPRKVMAVMAAPAETLDGKTPPQWLAGAGDPIAVEHMLESLARA